jgi:hypothetical protein
LEFTGIGFREHFTFLQMPATVKASARLENALQFDFSVSTELVTRLCTKVVSVKARFCFVETIGNAPI